MATNPRIDNVNQFRSMLFEDVPRVMEIEKQVYNHTWTEGIFHDCIRVGYHCWVLEIEGKVQAYGLVSVAASEAHILNICVAREFQRQGYGKKMLHKLLAEAEQKGVDFIYLEVRESNMAAINLYDQEGFSRLGARKKYYPADDGREDALVFAKALNLPKE
ncbi:MAG: [ribosomal protein S18]-alanine N-acetyltransferase [Pseudomonadota bacterium]|nr:[ribosomal protein S18]-alanine N-acetyltransferase [Pseudomonadota bacterium]